MLSGNGRGPIGAGGFEWGSAAPGAAPQPVPVVRWCGRALFPAHGSQPGAPRRRAVPALEQSPHCLRSGAPTRPRRCPRGAESAPGACGVTSALLCPAWRCSPGLRATHRSLHLPALQVGVPFPEPSPPPPPSSPVLLPTLRPRTRAGRRPARSGPGRRCRTGRSGSAGAGPSVPQPGCSARAGRGRLRSRSGLVAFHPSRLRGLCRERSGSREVCSIVHCLTAAFCLQGLTPVPFGSGLAPEGAPPLAAEGLPERFASPAERPAPSYSSMEEVD